MYLIDWKLLLIRSVGFNLSFSHRTEACTYCWKVIVIPPHILIYSNCLILWALHFRLKCALLEINDVLSNCCFLFCLSFRTWYVQSSSSECDRHDSCNRDDKTLRTFGKICQCFLYKERRWQSRCKNTFVNILMALWRFKKSFQLRISYSGFVSMCSLFSYHLLGMPVPSQAI